MTACPVVPEPAKKSRTIASSFIEPNFTIDFIKFVAGITKDRFKHIVPYAKAYVESYERQQQLENGDAETIQVLKDQLTDLLETRDNLDMQITDLQQKLESLSNTENKGGIKK